MSLLTSIVKLEGRIQPYAWGSRSSIAEIQGRPTPTESPEAELWFGDHHNAPSRVAEASGTTELGAWCAVRGVDALGAGRSRLPFLVKILAAAEPLSIQLHPDAQQAADGYARQEAAGIPRDDAKRSYSDPNPKIEALCALDHFEALCGFRAGADVRRLIAQSQSSVARQILASAGESRPEEELAGAIFRSVLKLESEDRFRASQLADEMTRYAEREANDPADSAGLAGSTGSAGLAGSTGSAEARWIGRLAAAHPKDRMLIAPLLLNHIALEPGQLLEVAPRTAHTYLSGTGVEVLTNSDNVVRCGLTRKYVAPDEFAKLVGPRAATPQICPAPSQSSTEQDHRLLPYPLQHTGFQISGVTARPDDAKRPLTAGAGQPRILLCVRGELELLDAARATTVRLSAGTAALIPACVNSFEMTGAAEGFLVEPGQPH